MAAIFIRSRSQVDWPRALARHAAWTILLSMGVAGTNVGLVLWAGGSMAIRQLLAPAAMVAVMSLLWLPIHRAGPRTTAMCTSRRISVRSAPRGRLFRWLITTSQPTAMIGPNGVAIHRRPAMSTAWIDVQAAFLAGDRVRLLSTTESLSLRSADYDQPSWGRLYMAVRESLQPHLLIPSDMIKAEHRRFNHRALMGWRRLLDLSLLVLLVLAMAGIGLLGVWASRWFSGLVGFVPPLLLAGGIMVASTLWGRRRTREERALWHLDCCRSCGYELTGLEAMEITERADARAELASVRVICPECGQATERSAARVGGLHPRPALAQVPTVA